MEDYYDIVSETDYYDYSNNHNTIASLSSFQRNDIRFFHYQDDCNTIFQENINDKIVGINEINDNDVPKEKNILKF